MATIITDEQKAKFHLSIARGLSFRNTSPIAKPYISKQPTRRIHPATQAKLQALQITINRANNV